MSNSTVGSGYHNGYFEHGYSKYNDYSNYGYGRPYGLDFNAMLMMSTATIITGTVAKIADKILSVIGIILTGLVHFSGILFTKLFSKYLQQKCNAISIQLTKSTPVQPSGDDGIHTVVNPDARFVVWFIK